MSTKSNAFSAFSEFGPDRQIPRYERLRSQFPKVPPEEVNEWLNDFRLVEEKAYDLALEHRRLNLKPEETIRKLQTAFPFLDEVSAGKAFNQAMYFTWKDGA